MYFARSSVDSLHENLGLYLLCNLKPCLASAWWKPLLKRPEVLTCSPPPSLFPFQCLILQIDIIRCIIRPLIHHGNGLGRSVAQMCFSPPPSLAVSKALEPLFSFSSSFLCSSKGLAAAERLGGRGGAEGGGGGCNWRLEPCYPSRCPHQPISILSAVQSRRSIRKTRPLTSILILYGLCECEKVFHVAWVSVQDYLLDLVLSLIWSQHQTVIFRLGMCCRQAIRPSCPSLALTAVFVCDMQMSPFFFFLFWVEVSAECRQRRLLTLTVKWASLCKSIGCSAGQRFI